MEEKRTLTAINGEMQRPADRALIERLRSGDGEAEEELYGILAPRLKATAAYFLGWQDPDVEDVVQQTFMAAFERLDGYDPDRGGIYTWANQICVYFCFKRVRRRKRLVHVLAQDLENLAGSAPTPAEDGRPAALREAVAALDEPCRSLVARRIYGGESYAVLARDTKAPMGTVASRLARCLRTLRKSLTTEG